MRCRTLSPVHSRGQHVQRRSTWGRWWPLAAVAALVAAGAGVAIGVHASSSSSNSIAAGSGSGGGFRGHQTTTTVPESELVARLAAKVSFQPPLGETAVLPNAPVQVSTPVGKLTAVQVVSPAGVAVPGALDTTAQHWTASGGLEAGEQYSIAATVQAPDGLIATSHSSFTTEAANDKVKDILLPNTGTIVGVGEPVTVKFSQSVTDPTARASVLSHFTIVETQPVPGGWYWFSPKELHFRPQTFWPVGEKVTVTSNLAGWNAGDGNWGTLTNSVSFAVGDSHVSVANLASHVMTVSDNGRPVYTFPISGGRDQYPTMDGWHIAMDKEPVVHMVSSTVGIPVNSPNGYDEFVYDDVHISDSGEYVHSAPWSVGAQGNTNVSHGCVNISPANAVTFMNFTQVGDVIQVVGSPRPPVAGDHGVMDWDTDWSLWTPGTVTPATPPPTPTTAATTPTTTTLAPQQAAVRPGY